MQQPDLILALAIVYTVLAALDVAVTLRNLRRGAEERNAVIRLGQRLFGRDGGVVIIKAACVAVVWALLRETPAAVLAAGVGAHLYWAARGFKK